MKMTVAVPGLQLLPAAARHAAVGRSRQSLHETAPAFTGQAVAAAK